ncbi:MAG: methyl-accepting chemotaxis protein [Exilibacterium sp.]
MSLFSRIKISHKLGALMAGLTLGFISIGVAYFLQLSFEYQHVDPQTYHEEDYIKALFIALLFIVATGTAISVFLVYKSIAFPLAHIQSIISKVNSGNLKARVQLQSGDELSELGDAFNKLLDERIQTLEDQARENDRLNNSIITLIKALGVIAQKDLTIKVPVSSDITGTISDAVNLLTSETAKTLFQVKDISERVNAVSKLLQKQSEIVVKVASEERRYVIATEKALEQSSNTMSSIAKNAEHAKGMAEETIENTQCALSTVTESITGIKTIRSTISETEKRIKRLGDRSQEITGIVNLINSIAERTHILALNASMHAASAGEAGKGFAVVAEEVQRLAENAREATSHISSMVNNIRIETSDTVSTMNRLISEVAEGTRQAEKAGQQMAQTEASTRRLVETVHDISESSITQAKLTTTVRNRATAIKKITEQTGKKLMEQKNYTENMKIFSQQLVDQVNIFTLPEWLSRSASGNKHTVAHNGEDYSGQIIIEQKTDSEILFTAPLLEENPDFSTLAHSHHD